MCLAEASCACRIHETADRLIRDKMAAARGSPPVKVGLCLRQCVDLGPHADRAGPFSLKQEPTGISRHSDAVGRASGETSHPPDRHLRDAPAGAPNSSLDGLSKRRSTRPSRVLKQGDRFSSTCWEKRR